MRYDLREYVQRNTDIVMPGAKRDETSPSWPETCENIWNETFRLTDPPMFARRIPPCDHTAPIIANKVPSLDKDGRLASVLSGKMDAGRGDHHKSVVALLSGPQLCMTAKECRKVIAWAGKKGISGVCRV